MATLLLDTHTLLWYLDGSSSLPDHVRSRIDELTASVFVSAASVWELSIKVGKGKIVLGIDLDELCRRFIDVGWQILPIGAAEAAMAGTLPPHHNDPFDRLLIAQAIVEGIPLISSDLVLDAYPIQRLW